MEIEERHNKRSNDCPKNLDEGSPEQLAALCDVASQFRSGYYFLLCAHGRFDYGFPEL